MVPSVMPEIMSGVAPISLIDAIAFHTAAAVVQ